ncbi:methyl-accepting chemotaxis protein [Clostridium felsineum]|uniref:methyl-accepting chemotaxis protein n=1 Tax=Clostridium felsineum TaxID=36839 RepID=UPI0009C4308F|nr:methyl-accepting chemotaxis protein [Clostridium felsineum]URZ17002.1 Methyl-accepting chemotaxis protein McpB [Clostridium felsineum DSM 794]
MRMRKKSIICMLLISIVPLLVVSIFSNLYFQKTLTKEITDKNLNLVSQTKFKVESFISEPISLIKTLSSYPVITSFNTSDSKAILVNAQNNEKSSSGVQIVLDDASGNQIVRGDANSLVNISKRSYFKDAINGVNESKQIVLGKNTNILTLNVGIPIKDSNGSIKGIIQGGIPLKKISDYVKSLSNNGSTVYIVDNDGLIVAHPNNNLVVSRKNLSSLNYIKAALSSKKDGTYTYNDSKKGKMLVSTTYDSHTGWVICNEIPYSVAMKSITTLNTFMLIFCILICIIIIAIGIIISNKLTNPIIKLQNLSERIAKGDLSVDDYEIKTKDEFANLAHSFSTMSQNLKSLILHIKESYSNLENVSNEMLKSCSESASAFSDISQNIVNVADDSNISVNKLNEANNSVLELMNVFSDVISNVDDIISKVKQTSSVSLKGKTDINKITEQMTNIDNRVNSLSDSIAKLKKHCDNIHEYSKVISDIAEETNLLSLNANIEAARAGENGKGFSVVADKIRSLADESGKAASEIGDLINEMNDDSIKAMESMNIGKTEVNTGKVIVKNTTLTFNEIESSINSILSRASKVTSSMEIVKASSENATSNMNSIKNITLNNSSKIQNIAASSEEQSAFSDEIKNQASKLQEVSNKLHDNISIFKI